MTVVRGLEAGLYGTAALLLLATVAVRLSDTQESRTRQTAEAGLDTLQAAERTHLAARKQFASFGPADSELSAALPGVSLPGATDFTFDALPDQAGVLHLRAVTRPDAVASGRVFPMLRSRDVVGGPVAEPAPGEP